MTLNNLGFSLFIIKVDFKEAMKVVDLKFCHEILQNNNQQ